MPPAGSAAVRTTIVEMADKGSAAVVATRTDMRDGADTLIAVGEGTVFIRGAGGWGGARGSTARPEPPTGPPLHESSFRTASNQALLYRLNADRNPLHSDPAFAARAGFERPILHGLCTFGIAARAVAAAIPSTARLTELSAQFSNPAYPGDNLTARMWEPTPQGMRFDTLADDGRQVLASGVARFG
jgi:acyl dehydratase